jgi:multidrug transporter EmrE-like cation transporter
MAIIFLALSSICLSVAAQFVLKAAVMNSSLKTLKLGQISINNMWQVLDFRLAVGFFLYGLSAVLWLTVLAKWDVSKAYPLVGFGFVISIFIGSILGETITINRLLGVFLICIGVIIVANS